MIKIVFIGLVTFVNPQNQIETKSYKIPTTDISTCNSVGEILTHDLRAERVLKFQWKCNKKS